MFTKQCLKETIGTFYTESEQFVSASTNKPKEIQVLPILAVGHSYFPFTAISTSFNFELKLKFLTCSYNNN